MELVFFDLDGTLLNKESKLSSFTKETLDLLSERGIAHTVATGRTMHSAQHILGEEHFFLPHIYNNGVTLWDPKVRSMRLENLLSDKEIRVIVECAKSEGLAPFVNTVDIDTHKHIIFHAPARHQVEKDLIHNYFARTGAHLQPLETMSLACHVTNISMIGESSKVLELWKQLNRYDGLVAYTGPATEGKQFHWMDVHHRLANKGSAVEKLKQELGASKIICFGDSDNDKSMFALADECYAPSNANPEIKELANDVIGHHHEDGVARFLRERFSL